MDKASDHSRNTYHVGNLAPLLLAAGRVMLEQVGPAKLSIRAISENVGVSATATYHHFANRVDLLSHIAAQGFKELECALKARPNTNSKLDLLKNASLIYFQFAQKNPALYQLMFGSELSNIEIFELNTARTSAFNELKKIIAEVLDKEVNDTEVKQAALSTWTYTHGLASLVIQNVIDYPSEMSNENFINRILQGFEYLFQKLNT